MFLNDLNSFFQFFITYSMLHILLPFQYVTLTRLIWKERVNAHNGESICHWFSRAYKIYTLHKDCCFQFWTSSKPIILSTAYTSNSHYQSRFNHFLKILLVVHCSSKLFHFSSNLACLSQYPWAGALTNYQFTLKVNVY